MAIRRLAHCMVNGCNVGCDVSLYIQQHFFFIHRKGLDTSSQPGKIFESQQLWVACCVISYGNIAIFNLLNHSLFSGYRTCYSG